MQSLCVLPAVDPYSNSTNIYPRNGHSSKSGKITKPVAHQVIIASTNSCVCEIIHQKAYLAPLFQDGNDILSDTQEVVVDSGSTMTLTGSSRNCKNCKPTNVKFQLAKKGETMMAQYECIKTYYALNRSGEIDKIELPAYIVPELKTELIGCKTLTEKGYRIVFDDKPLVSGIFPIGPKGETDLSKSFEFKEGEGLYILNTFCSSDGFHIGKGFSMWHYRLSHTDPTAIQKSIPYTKGMESLRDQAPDKRPCTDCMIGKAQRNPRPKEITKLFAPMEQVHWDLVTSTTTSLEGYNYALVIVDRGTRFKWSYGLKTKDETFACLRKWWADTSRIRKRHPLLCLVRDNAPENLTAELREFFESRGVELRKSAPYEQWQDGTAETAIRTVGRLVRSELSASGLPTSCWYAAWEKADESFNVTWVKQTDMSPYFHLHEERKDVSKIRRLGCEAFVYLEPERRAKSGKFEPRAKKGIYLGPATSANTSAVKIWIPKENKIYITNQVKYNEYVLPLKTEHASRPNGQPKEIFDYSGQAAALDYKSEMVDEHLLDEMDYFEKGDERLYRLKGTHNSYVWVNRNKIQKDVDRRNRKYNMNCDITYPPETGAVFQVDK